MKTKTLKLSGNMISVPFTAPDFSPEGVACVPDVGPFGIPSDFPVQPIGLYDAAIARCTCGHCGLSWDDGIATSYTPAPSGRCPFEAFHQYEDDAVSAADCLSHSALVEAARNSSPAESVSLEAMPSSTSPGLDSSSADVPPVAVKTRYFASSLMGAPGEYTVDIMREVTTESTTTTGLYAALECTRLPFELQREADRLVELLNGGAAHLAKIQALTEASKELLEASYGPFESDRAMQRLYDARAQVIHLTSETLSLPSA